MASELKEEMREGGVELVWSGWAGRGVAGRGAGEGRCKGGAGRVQVRAGEMR